MIFGLSQAALTQCITRSVCTVSAVVLLVGCSKGGGDGGTAAPVPTYTIQSTVVGAGAIQPTSKQVKASETAEFKLLPTNNQTLLSVKGCNGTLSGSVYTVRNLQAGCTITATFSTAQGDQLTTVTVDKTLLDQQQQYFLVSTQSTQPLDQKAVTQETVVAAPADNSPNASQLTLLAVTNSSGNPVMMAIAPVGTSAQVSIDTSAEVFVLNTVALAGVKVTNYAAFSSRVRQQPEFEQIKTLIREQIEQNSPCPMSNECNASAALLAERLAAKVNFSDIVTSVGV
jgi:hypothetical protein